MVVTIIQFVDLASSERRKPALPHGGHALTVERGSICRGLFNLGVVLDKVSTAKITSKVSVSPTKVPFIPWRDSKLTRVLKCTLKDQSNASVSKCVVYILYVFPHFFVCLFFPKPVLACLLWFNLLFYSGC